MSPARGNAKEVEDNAKHVMCEATHRRLATEELSIHNHWKVHVKDDRVVNRESKQDPDELKLEGRRAREEGTEWTVARQKSVA